MEVINPLYDTSFKYLMEDERSAKILLSALLRQKVLSLSPRQQETAVLRKKQDIAIYRLDYSAHVLTDDGLEEDVCIELQKVWLKTELGRFRTYIASQYGDKKNVQSDHKTPRHIIVIYLLGHMISETDEPVAYCYGGHMTDYYGKPIKAGDGKFVRSLTHDVIIVQIPRLPAKPRNATERVLSIFAQRNLRGNGHLIEVPDTPDEGSDLDILQRRLCRAACDSGMRRKMDLEDEYIEEIQLREEENELQKIKIGEQEKQLKEQEKQLRQREELLGEKDKQLRQKDEQLGDVLRKSIRTLGGAGLAAEAIAASLGVEVGYVESVLNQK